LPAKAEFGHHYVQLVDRAEGRQGRGKDNSRRRTSMKLLKALIALAIFSSCLAILATAKPEYAKKEGKPCTFCHVKMGSKEEMAKELTDAGKYYKEHDHSLKGYKAPEKK
jgi:tRNA U54 and U55 pseudouridine synthase Pus10